LDAVDETVSMPLLERRRLEMAAEFELEASDLGDLATRRARDDIGRSG